MRVANHIYWSPANIADAIVLAGETGAEMMARLDWMTLKPIVIVEIGQQTKAVSEQLRARYPDATVMTIQGSTIETGTAAAELLTLPAQHVDLIFANLLMPWPDSETPSLLLKAWRRLLRPEGLLMVTVLGPDTLQACEETVDTVALPYFLDMHNLGDMLLQTGFADPVLDVDYYTVTSRDNTPCQINYEIIYAHAFAVDVQTQQTDGTVSVSLSQLRRQLRGKS
ncbi:MAG TPA: methyltransferase domain-containing protein [Gammaproteobacteria bacterium]|jgi:malonyl-CoA O-methyltransferase|nr:methyltransferase domain-containing protein [Gammaproteobacteria bacterium]